MEKRFWSNYWHGLLQGYLIDRRFYRWKTKKKPKLKTISITLCPYSRAVPGIHFQTKPGQQVRFSAIRLQGWNTGLSTGLRLQQVEQGDEDDRWVFPNNYAYLEYRIEPKLGREQLSVLDCQEGERPYLKAKSPDSRFLPKSSVVRSLP